MPGKRDLCIKQNTNAPELNSRAVLARRGTALLLSSGISERLWAVAGWSARQVPCAFVRTGFFPILKNRLVSQSRA
jgi:hypothetical protein